MKGQILICVGGLTVHRGADGAIFFSVQEDVKGRAADRKCQLFTDEGSRRLLKCLNYCFSVLASATNRSKCRQMLDSRQN